MDIQNIPTSNQLRAARQLLKLTQSQFAKMAKVSVSSLKKYESAHDGALIFSIVSYVVVEKILNFCTEKNIKFVCDDSVRGVLIEL